jgi:hypothetical protein
MLHPLRREPWRTLAFMAASMVITLLGMLHWNVNHGQSIRTRYVRPEIGADGAPTQAAAAFELQTLEEAARLAEMGDLRSFPAWRASGDVFMLNDGTAVRELEQSGYYSRVEIMDGVYARRRAGYRPTLSARRVLRAARETASIKTVYDGAGLLVAANL